MEDSRGEEAGSGEADLAKREELRAITRSTGAADLKKKTLAQLVENVLPDLRQDGLAVDADNVLEVLKTVFDVDLSGRQHELDGIIAKLAKPKKQRGGPAKKRGMEAELPLVIPRQVVKKSAMLCQVEDEELDLKGDTGAIGRIQFKNDECHIDVKGRQYGVKIFPTHTCMVVHVTPTEAKVEAMMNDVAVLTFERNVVDAFGDFRERDEDEQGADAAEKAADDSSSKPKAKKPKITTIKSRQSTGKKAKNKKK